MKTKNNMKKQLLLAIILFTVLLTSCNVLSSKSKSITQKGDNKTKNELSIQKLDIFQTQWELIRMGASKPNLTGTDNKVSILFSKDNSHFAGFSGCNRYSGKYEIKKESLLFDNIISTKMACPEADMTFETNYINTLNKVNNFAINGDTLFLKNNGRAVLIYIAK